MHLGSFPNWEAEEVPPVNCGAPYTRGSPWQKLYSRETGHEPFRVSSKRQDGMRSEALPSLNGVRPRLIVGILEVKVYFDGLSHDA